MGRKSNKEIIKEQGITIRKLFVAYTFLLCALVIFLYSLHNMSVDYNGVQLNFMAILLPLVFFLAGVINKELGYKWAMRAVVLSTVVLFCYSLTSRAMITGDFDIIGSVGTTVAYIVSQSVCLAIYNYLLINTRLPIAGVIITYIFALLINNMICMLFVKNMVFTDSFWLEYILLILFQGCLAIILSMFDAIVERGID